MTPANETKLHATLGAVLAFLIAFGPDIVTALASIEHPPTWLPPIAKAVGLIVGLATTGKGVALLNRFLPSAPTNTASVIPVAPMTTGDAPEKVLPMVGPQS
jgi:hypothetical protein